MNISFTLLAVFADVSMKSKPLSSAYAWASCNQQHVQLMPLTPPSHASFKFRLVLPFWYRLTQVVLKKRPSNRCSSSTMVQVQLFNIHTPETCRWLQTETLTTFSLSLAQVGSPGRPRIKWSDKLWSPITTQSEINLRRTAIHCDHRGGAMRWPSPATQLRWWWQWWRPSCNSITM